MTAPNNNRAFTLLKRYGYRYAGVERRLARNITQDFCGFADVLAFRPLTGSDLAHFPNLFSPDFPTDKFPLDGCLALQLCSYATFQEHLRKLTQSATVTPYIFDWLLARNRLEVWAFSSPRDRRAKGRHPPKFARIQIQSSPENPGELRLEIVHNVTELQFFGYEDIRIPTPQE